MFELQEPLTLLFLLKVHLQMGLHWVTRLWLFHFSLLKDKKWRFIINFMVQYCHLFQSGNSYQIEFPIINYKILIIPPWLGASLHFLPWPPRGNGPESGSGKATLTENPGPQSWGSDMGPVLPSRKKNSSSNKRCYIQSSATTSSLHIHVPG